MRQSVQPGFLTPQADPTPMAEEQLEEVRIRSKVTVSVCQPGIRNNIIVMSILWMTTIMGYFVINFYLKYIPGGLYLNFTIAGLSEIAAHATVSVTI